MIWFDADTQHLPTNSVQRHLVLSRADLHGLWGLCMRVVIGNLGLRYGRLRLAAVLDDPEGATSVLGTSEGTDGISPGSESSSLP